MPILYQTEAPITFGDGFGEHQNLLCPACGYHCLHPGTPATQARTGGQIAVPFQCEGCDAALTLGMRFAKGVTFMGWTFLSGQSRLPTET